MNLRDFIRPAVVGCLAVLLTSCNDEIDTEATKDDEIVIVQEWFPYAGFAGEALAVEEYAAQNGVEMALLAGGETSNPITRVRLGEATIGVASADKVLAASIEGNYDLRVIGVVNEQSPTVFLAPKSMNVRSSKDFTGKRVGILEGTNTESIYRLLKLQNNVGEGTIEEVPVPFTVDSFVDGQYDIRPAFVYDEPVTLDNRAFEYSIVYPKDEGIDFLGTVYFTTADSLEGDQRGDIVMAVRALIQGWSAVTDKENGEDGRARAIGALVKQFPEVDANRERASLDLGFTYFANEERGPLFAERSKWEATIQGLNALGQIDGSQIDLDRILDESVRAEACEGIDICE